LHRVQDGRAMFGVRGVHRYDGVSHKTFNHAPATLARRPRVPELALPGYRGAMGQIELRDLNGAT
jgi:hypothetical protein